MLESMLDYLHKVHREPVPRWLKDGEFSLDKFFESRTVYYPGAGMDGSPIKLFNRSHAAHCFVWVDQGYQFDAMRAGGQLALKGYYICHVHRTDMEIGAGDGDPVVQPACHMVVYDRCRYLGDDHGAERLALLVVRAEAHGAYEQIYGDRFRENRPFGVVLQECMIALAGGLFGGPVAPIYAAARANGLPRFLLVGADNTRPWPGYVRLENLRRIRGGMPLSRRWLYQLRADKRREHAERVRPFLQLAARFRIPEDRLVEWLEFNGAPPPSGSRWSLRTAHRIGRRLGLWPYQ